MECEFHAYFTPDIVQTLRTQQKKYVITGPPGSGKSSVIRELHQRGEYVVTEAAQQYIEYRQSLGEKKPWALPDFQDGLARLIITKESQIPLQAKRVFLDRSMLDNLAYDPNPSRFVLEYVGSANYQKKVFFLEMLPVCETNGFRRENFEEAIEQGEKIRQVYQSGGYEVISIPTIEIQKRVNLILESI